ncbi:outer membrane beta-barrel protein [Mucilaginibacter sp.]|uniref:outer membrane beta-barrel protein n=1 Tax=Mucilaginibacter sp. TaxID=1882438 RepID=UPI002ED3B5DB
MKVILSALLLLLCLNSIAQSTRKAETARGIISGKIVSAKDGQVIEGATIILESHKDSLYKNVIHSDHSGTFEFKNLRNGTYSLEIKHLGFKEITIGQVIINAEKPSENLSEIKLEIAENDLKEVVIRARQKSYTEQKIDRTIVNVSQLLSNNGVSAIEVLNNTPGVNVTDDAISLRGKQGVTIYIDGRQTFLNGAQLVNYLKSLPSGTIEKLELMPVPPAKYHVEGNTGLINIITKKNHTEGFNGGLTATHGRGHYAKANYSLNLNYKIGKLNFFGNAAYTSNNNYYKVDRERDFSFAAPSDNYTIKQNNLENNNRKSTRYKLGFDAELDTNTSIGLVIDGSVSPYKEQGNYLLQFNHALPDSIIKTQSDLNRHTNDAALNFYYQHKFKKEGENIRIDADYLHYTDNALQLLNSDTYLPNSTELVDNYKLITQNPFEANVYSLKSDYETKIFSGIKLSAGVQSIYSKRASNGIYFNRSGIQNDSLTSSNTYAEHINAAYVGLNKELKKFSFELGLRFENSSSRTRQYNFATIPYPALHLNYNNLFPKLYISYKLDTASVNTFNFSFDYQINRPDYSSLNPFAFYFDRYTSFQGNASLLPEKTIGFDLSFTHSGIFTVGTSFNKGRNTIIQFYYVNGQSLVNTSLNIRSNYNITLYSTVAAPIFKWWTTNLFGQVSKQLFQGEAINNDFLYNRVFTFEVSGNNQFKLNKGLSAEISGFYRTRTTFGQGYYLPMFRVNTSLQKKIFNNKATITLAGSDIFHSWKIRREIRVNNALVTSNIINDTRQINLTLAYRFGLESKKRVNKSGLETERGRAGVN